MNCENSWLTELINSLINMSSQSVREFMAEIAG